MADRIVNKWASGKLDTFHGKELGAALFTADLVPTAADTTVDSLVGEITTDDYVRASFFGSWDDFATELDIYEPDQWPSFVDSSGFTIAWAVVFLADGSADDGRIIAVHGFEPYDGVIGDTLELLGGIAQATDATDFETRLEVVEDAIADLDPGTGTGLPDGGTTGQVLAKVSDDDGDADWVDPSAAGTVTSDQVNVLDGPGGDPVATLTEVDLPGLFTRLSAVEDTVAVDAWLPPVRAISVTANAAEAGDVVDGVTLAEGDLVLGVGALGSASRIFRLPASGPGTGAVPSGAYQAGATVKVGPESASFPNTEWVITTSNPIGTSDTVTWEQVVGTGGAPSGAAGGDLSGTYPNPTVPGLALKAPLASPTFTGTPAAPTATAGTNTTQVATTAYVVAAITALIASAPGALDTLDELAAALGDDPNFATTVTNALAGKVPGTRTLAGLDLTADRSASALRTALALVPGTDVQAYDTDLAAIAALSTTTFGRALLELANAAALRSAAGLVIGTDVQAYDAELAAIAGLTSAADRFAYFTGSGSASLATLTAFARSMLDDADAATVRATIGAPSVTGGGGETVYSAGTVTGTWTPNLANGNYQYATAGSNLTIGNPINVLAGASSFTFELIQDSTGGRSFTFPSSFKWADIGTIPTIPTTANSVSIITGLTRDGGTTWRTGLYGRAFA